ncbi:hypothetical protein CCACVL1_03375 [Corchorus capsularis]|uniref:Uncharacterized protein n=1 Tax=Corchorus capsularis TaxID=210143 RepID=A0A1R3JZQ8_COCAP|nr:hypothetical protein CCACVL1_03375 [Corchorus capsularis]
MRRRNHTNATGRGIARRAPGARMASSYHRAPGLQPIRTAQKWTKFAIPEGKLLRICQQFHLSDMPASIRPARAGNIRAGQPVQQCPVQRSSVLNLWRMARIRKLHQRRTRNRLGSGPTQFRVVAQAGAHFRGRRVLGDGGGVLLADQQQCPGAHLAEFVHHRLCVDHVVQQGRVPGHKVSPRPAIHAGQHLHPGLVVGAPLARVVSGLLIGADALGGGLLLTCKPLVDRHGWHALGLPVFQANRVDHHQPRNFGRIHQRIARGQHAAGRVADQDGLLNAQRGQQRMRVARQLLERILIRTRLARFAEADLVRRDHAIAGARQRLDRAIPGGRAEVLAVQQHCDLAVGLLGLDVQIGHLQRIALGFELEQVDRRRIVEALQPGAIRGAALSGGDLRGHTRHCQGGNQRNGNRAKQHQHTP